MTRNPRLGRVRDELDARGLLRRSRRGRTRRGAEQGLGDRLAEGLAACGGLFGLFGRYLATRVDWLPLRDSLVLEHLRDDVKTTPMARVADIVGGRSGGPPREIFASFGDPRRSSAVHQWHDAELADGTPVAVKIVRPEARSLVDDELGLLPVLEALELGGDDPIELVEDFVVWLDRQLDLGEEADTLDALRSEVGELDAFEIPSVRRELCGRDVAVTERIDGADLWEILANPGDLRPRLARRLCQAWFEQTLLEGTCFEGPLATNLTVISDQRYAITGGLASALDPAWRRHLLDAVTGTARNDPDRVCEAMLAESAAREDAVDRDRLRSELRQAETFRCEGWTEGSGGRRIAETLFVYWRLLRRSGYRPKAHVVSFVRGVYQLEVIARTLDPDRDALTAAVDDLRLVAAATAVRENLGPGAVRRAAERLIPVLGGLFDQPDRLARRLEEPDSGAPPDSDAGSTTRRSPSWMAFGGGVAVVAAVSILGVAVLRAHPGIPWLQAAVATAFVAAAGGLFGLVARSGGGSQ